MITLLVDEVAHFFQSQQSFGIFRIRIAGEAFGQHGGCCAAFLISLIKTRQRIDGNRAGSRQILQFGLRQRRVAKHWIGKNFVQLGLRASFFIACQPARINVEYIDQTQ